MKNCVFVYTLLFEPVVRSRSILGLDLPSSANGNVNDHYQSIGIVCLSVNSVVRKRSISFNLRRRPLPSWIVEFAKFYWLTVSGGSRRRLG